MTQPWARRSISLDAAQLVALVAAPVPGGWLGRRISGRAARRAVVIAAALAAAFWRLARDSSWAKEPPPAVLVASR